MGMNVKKSELMKSESELMKSEFELVKKKTESGKARTAFTLLELLSVLLIMSILAGATIPLYSRYAETKRLENNASIIRDAGRALGEVGIRSDGFAFLTSGDDVFTTVFNDAGKRTEWTLAYGGDGYDAYAAPIRIFSTYSDVDLTGTIVVYSYDASADASTIGGASVKARKTPDGSACAYLVFEN